MSIIKSRPPKSISKLSALEGMAAQGYFYAWRGLQLNWKATGKYPIPEDWKRYLSRSSLNTRVRITNYRATHPVNAMLNYAYGVLEASTRIETIAEGYDPSIGLMHDSLKSEKHSFVHDRMEPLRPIADRAILKLLKEEKFSGADFMMQRDGVCRLTPAIARLIVGAASRQSL